MNSPAVYHIILVRKTVVLVYQEHAAQLKDNIFILSAMCKVIVLYVATIAYLMEVSSPKVLLFLLSCLSWLAVYCEKECIAIHFPPPTLTPEL